MTDFNSPTPPRWTPSARLLWGVVGALSVLSLALGAALVQVKTQKSADVAALHALADVPKLDLASLSPASAASQEAAPEPPPVANTSASKVAPARVKHANAAIKKVAKPAPTNTSTAGNVSDGRPTGAEPAPQPEPKVVCQSCGTVEAVTPVQRDGAASGGGAVAGAVLGGLVGNQFGGGDGKTLATVLGAVGGGFAGNTVEKRMKKETVYQVDVRMVDGSRQTFEQPTPPAVGARVSVEGGVIRPL